MCKRTAYKPAAESRDMVTLTDGEPFGGIDDVIDPAESAAIITSRVIAWKTFDSSGNLL
ncbi:MAG: hypothetical protein O3A84_02680 [Proteobacteria bacterium]|nr:hypothetical protein [Pseudomonadota bacterium]